MKKYVILDLISSTYRNGWIFNPECPEIFTTKKEANKKIKILASIENRAISTFDIVQKEITQETHWVIKFDL